MNNSGLRLRVLKASILIYLGVALSACANNPTPPSVRATTDTTETEPPPIQLRQGGVRGDGNVSAPSPEPSVRPGVNDAYFKEGALQRYTGILEAESREVVESRDAIVDAIGLQEGMVVADIGAGTGLFTTALAKGVGDEGLVFAVDIVPSFLQRIEERVRAERLSNVRVIEGTEKSTGLRRGSIDLAFLCDTYHHIEFPESYLQSLFDTLRPGGTLVLIDFERIEGVTSPAVMRHVRAGKQAVIREVARAGFVLLSEDRPDFLGENYLLRFRRP